MKLNATVADRDAARLTEKQYAVLARLQRGPATNRQLNDICFSYRQRLSELRQAGYQIDCEKREDGLTRYSLVHVVGGQLALAGVG